MKCQGACLSTKEIIDIFKKYLDNTVYNYAFMLNGSWGSGKTYFVKESLIPAIQNHEFQKNKINPQYKQRQVLYISLYGIKDTEEISRLLYMQLRNDLAEKATGAKFLSRTRLVISSIGSLQELMPRTAMSPIANIDNFLRLFINLFFSVLYLVTEPRVV